MPTLHQDPLVQFFEDEELPNHDLEKGSVFLAGPNGWRTEGVSLLRKYGFNGWIYCPEPRETNGPIQQSWEYMDRWESLRLIEEATSAEHAIFWTPYSTKRAPGILNFEYKFELQVRMRRVMPSKWGAGKLFVGSVDGSFMSEVFRETYSSLDTLCATLVAVRNHG